MAGYPMVSAGGKQDKPWRYRSPDTILMDKDSG